MQNKFLTSLNEKKNDVWKKTVKWKKLSKNKPVSFSEISTSVSHKTTENKTKTDRQKMFIFYPIIQ